MVSRTPLSLGIYGYFIVEHGGQSSLSLFSAAWSKNGNAYSLSLAVWSKNGNVYSLSSAVWSKNGNVYSLSLAV